MADLLRMLTCSVHPLPYHANPAAYFSAIRHAPGAVLLDSGRPTAERGRYDLMSAWPLQELRVQAGETGAEENVDEYGVRMKWTQPVYREWLIGEFIVGHYWPQREDRERERAWAMGVNLEMRF